MSEYDNFNPVPEQAQQTEEHQEFGNEEAPKKKTTTKISPAASANARSNQLVNKKYKFDQIEFDSKTKVYYIQAKSTNFDRIFRRIPREVNKNADDFIVPLGTTCIETIICAYGLSYGIIYSDETWLDLIQKFNKKQTWENAQKIIEFLRASAALKVLAMSGESYDPSQPILFTSKIQSVKEYDIVDKFCAMVR